jgi:hypothetical protein
METLVPDRLTAGHNAKPSCSLAALEASSGGEAACKSVATDQPRLARIRSVHP